MINMRVKQRSALNTLNILKKGRRLTKKMMSVSTPTRMIHPTAQAVDVDRTTWGVDVDRTILTCHGMLHHFVMGTTTPTSHYSAR